MFNSSVTKLNTMFSSIKRVFQKFMNLGAEDDHIEHQSSSRKRTVDAVDFDFDDNSTKKRKRVNVFSTQVTHEEDLFPARIPSSNSCITIMAESKKSGMTIMPKKGNCLCNSGLMQQSKGIGRSPLSSLNPIPGKENNVIEVSDDEESEGVHYLGGPAQSNSGVSTRGSAVPKLYPVHRSQHLTSFDNLRKVRNSAKAVRPDVFPFGKTGGLTGTPNMSTVISSRPLNAHTSSKIQRNKKPTYLQRYCPQSSLQRCVDTNVQLGEKIRFAELVEQYRDPYASKRHQSSHLLRSNKGATFRTSSLHGTQKTAIEVVDLTKVKKFEMTPVVRHDLEVQPETLASKMASVGMGAISKPKSQISQINTMEQLLKSNAYYQASYLQNTAKKYEQKNLETRINLQEPSMRVKEYRNKNEKDSMKLINQRLQRHLTITESEVIFDDVLVEDEPKLPTLTSRMQKAIDASLIQSPANDVLVEGFSLRITRRDMQTLANLNWLNDEVINFYMNLLIERGKLEKYPNVYAFSTFFYPKLLSGGHIVLKRWTRKIDIFSYKLIIVPVHLGVHWCMAAVDFEDKAIRYYDSMGGNNNKCLQALRKYLEEESIDKKKAVYDTSAWNMINVKAIPQQMNGSDCGVFACMYSEYISRRAKISFTQTTMPYFRRKMIYEILNAKLLEW